MTDERAFDPAAAEEYRQFLLDLLDRLETEVVPVLSEGTLSRAPAFGSAPGATGNAADQYLGFRAVTWRNLQYLRGTLHGLAAALADTATSEADNDAEISSMFNGFYPSDSVPGPDLPEAE
ncbi:hypothetical protein [Glycomyces salinus]|uniref:hypothetical protein n=1 Tax=Glycomyces salinus TaxID=980294 RepID=UPI0018EA3926|nr:hypothetical protein [Glycomyces salinus]